MNKNFCLRFGCMAGIVLAGIVQLSAQSATKSEARAKPTIQWKYGWQDGRLANTIGRARLGNALPSANSALSSGYSPAQVAHAYGFDQIPSNGDGRGQVIAIVDAYGSSKVQSDLNTFCDQYGLPRTTVNVVFPLGKPAISDSGWASETLLDVEWAHAMAPGATISLVVSTDDTVSNLMASVKYAANTLNANFVSMSWGTTEFSGARKYDSVFNTSGVTFVAASGDTAGEVDFPVSSPYVLGVGGTTMNYNATTGVLTSEVAWSSGSGGVSLYETLPAYQVGWNVNSGRGIPDVAYNADPYTGFAVYFTDPTSSAGGGWDVVGGTSAGAPQWAALLARRASLGNNAGGLFQTVAYGAKASYSLLFKDIVSGSNGYRAVKGYDLATGLGTPVASQIALLSGNLAVPLPTATPSPTPLPTPSPTPKPTPSASPSPSATPRPSPSATATPKPSPSATPTPPPSNWWWWFWKYYR